MSDNFCIFFDAIIAKYTLKTTMKSMYYLSSSISISEIMFIKIFFDLATVFRNIFI